MKGIVFTEFFSFIERSDGYEMVDYLIQTTNPATGGVYTAVGTYNHQELVMYIVEYAKKTEQEVGDVLRVFGKHIFGVFHSKYQHFFSSGLSLFEFLKSIDSYIHVEVIKLYPDAELPSFDAILVSSNQLKLVYQSERKLGNFAFGLIEAAIIHFKENATVVMNTLSPDETKVEFIITKGN
jgi:hypothetical protein